MKKKLNKILTMVICFALLSLTGCEDFINNIKNVKENTRPAITIKVENTNPDINSTQTLTAEVTDPDEDDEVTVTWTATTGELSLSTGLSVDWTAPADTATAHIVATAQDQNDGIAHKEVILFVGNAPPRITGFDASADKVVSGNTVNLTCSAADPEGGELTYRFYEINGGGSFSHSGPAFNTASWTSPSNIGQAEIFKLVVKVTDPIDFFTADTIDVLVYSNYGSLWVVDSDFKTVSKYTGNGYKILTSSEAFKYPVAVVSNVDELSGCFVADQDADQVYKLDFNGEKLTSYTNIPHVIDIALHQATRKLWALSYSSNSATVIDARTGTIEKTITGFHQPTRIDINQWTGDVWIVEEGNNRTIRIDAGSGVESLPDSISATDGSVFAAGFNSPHSLCIHHTQDGSRASRVYVADTYDNQIERFIYQNKKFDRDDPVDLLSPGPLLVGTLPVNLQNMVFVINTAGRMELFEEDDPLQKHPVTGNYNFIKPQVLAIDENTGECWIGDNGTNQLVKIKIRNDYSFSVLRKLNGFLSIKDISINK